MRLTTLTLMFSASLAWSCSRPSVDGGSSVLASADFSRCWTQGTSRDTAALTKAYTAIGQTVGSGADCAAIKSYLAGDAVMLLLSNLDLDDAQMKDVVADLNERIGDSTEVVALDLSRNRLSTVRPGNIKGVAGNLVYLNLAHNQYELNFLNALDGVPLDSLRHVDVSHNKMIGELQSDATEQLQNLYFLDLSGNAFNKVVFDGVFSSLAFLDTGRPVSANASMAGRTNFFVYESGAAFPNLVHLGVEGNALYEPNKLAVKADALGSLDAKGTVNQDLSKPIVTTAALVDVRGSRLDLADGPRAHTWRSDCGGVASCSTGGVMPIGGCAHYESLLSLRAHVPGDKAAAFDASLVPYQQLCQGA